MSRIVCSLAMAIALAGAASAQSVTQCLGNIVSVENIAEPWDISTKTFSNGATRLVLLDTVEPTVGAFHLMVLSPPYDELGNRQCRVISRDGVGTGFASLALEGMVSEYDPKTGLKFDLPAQRFVPESGNFASTRLTVTVNQATGAIEAELQ